MLIARRFVRLMITIFTNATWYEHRMAIKSTSEGRTAHDHSLFRRLSTNVNTTRTKIVLYSTVRRLSHCTIWFHLEGSSECHLQTLGHTQVHHRDTQLCDCNNAHNFLLLGIGGRIVCLQGNTDVYLVRKRILVKKAK